MKKVLSIVLSLTLVVGLLVGVQFTETKADGKIINCVPANGETVNLLSDNVYEFCAKYEKGAVNKYYKKNSNTYYPTPATLKWDAVTGAKGYTVEISENSDMSNPKTYSATTNSIEIEDLLVGMPYYYRVKTEVEGESWTSEITNFNTANLPRTTRVDKAYNTRDIGGCFEQTNTTRVLQGKVYRGARLDEISDAGKQKMLDVYGIKTDLDLREPEKAPTSSPLGDSVKFINISAPQYYSDSTGGINDPTKWPILKKEVEVFTDASNYPIYVHCNIGRDRTGTLLYLIEGLIGMKEIDIYRDYELSFFAQVSNSNISDPTAFNKANIDKMENYIISNFSGDTLQQKIENYMKSCLEITDEQIKQIKKNLLEKSVDPETTTEVTTSVQPETTKETTKAPTVKKPGKVKIKSAKNSKKKSIVVKYRKVSGAKGYQVWWATSKKFKKAKKKFTNKLTYKIKKLKRKKVYFVKVRAYNIKGQSKQYGSFSKTKKVKIKK